MDAIEAIQAMENYISRKIAARDGANQRVLTMGRMPHADVPSASAVNGGQGKLEDKRLTPYFGSMLSPNKHTAGWLQSAGDNKEQHPETVSSDPLSEWQELVECLDPREENDNACSMGLDEPKEDEPEAEECPVCLNALSEAKTLNCPNGHTFCRDCLRRVYMQTSPRVLACPLCRTTIDSSALKLRAFRAPKGGAIVTLRIGNTHDHLDGANASEYAHQWMCFVDVVNVTCRRRGPKVPLEALVSAVVFELHPTFDPHRISITASQSTLCASSSAEGAARRFSIERIGWGTFVVRITVIFCGSYRIIYKHRLSFADGSAVKEHRVTIGPDVIAAVATTQRLLRPLSRRSHTS